MKVIAPTALLLASTVQAQFQNTCSQQLMDALSECQKSSGTKDLMDFAGTVSNGNGRDKYCNTWTGCDKLKGLAPSSDCVFWVWKGWSVNPSKDLTCPKSDKATTFCTPNHLALSEGYGLLYANTVKGSANEQFVYDEGSQTILAKSNGQCLDVYKDNNEYKLHTYACDSNNANQKWKYANHKLQHATHPVCIQTDMNNPGAAVGVAACTSVSETNQWFDACDKVPTNYIQLKSSKGKHLLEYNGGLYVNSGGHDFNDLFQWDNNMIKSASSGQCLDVYKDNNGYKLHTYACDANNGNQKWTIANNVVKHATHNNICLDIDPTYADQHVQVWECTPNNPNQQWELIRYSK
ncbi:hypothetical protein THRCLA_05350 [Thraustotheca clavata]|uniref:Secreted protein n=1 Tax=Thraustotheca clavata TaxID=74557 RepID=A0A0A7CM68_9STRA|nr:secreted protein [Thraustotheca clavata]OQS02257.1 hypothetical protein THRCLA_05350 [Thraustotheca clavata]